MPNVRSPASHHRAGTISSRVLSTAVIALAIAGQMQGCGGDSLNADEPNPPSATTPLPATPAGPAGTGQLLSVRPVQIVTRDALNQIISAYPSAPILPAALCDVELNEITYTTVEPNGAPTTASAAVMIPSGATCPAVHPLVSYTRGTDLNKTRSMVDMGRGEVQYVTSLMAGAGDVVVSTDYLGYNLSISPRHYYLHADSEAQAQLDALRAARAVLASRQYAVEPKIFLAGYSQGGHASLATHKAITQKYASEFPLAGAVHMSGPYNLQRATRAAVDALPVGTLGSTLYIPFAITSLQAVYGTLYSTPSDYFRSPYDTKSDGLLPTTLTSDQLIQSGAVPAALAMIVTDRFVEDVRSNASALQTVLVGNSPVDFQSTVPTMLCGGRRDGVVSFGNAADAQAALVARGSAPVSVVDVESVPGYDKFLPGPLAPAALQTSYHASDVPPLCLAQLRAFFAALPTR